MNRSLILIFVICLACIAAGSLDAQAQALGPGNPFIDARAGALPIIVSAPHGGRLAPDSLADRSCLNCIVGADSGTQEWARELVAALERRTGRVPYLVINLLTRRKLDANREIVEAADGDPQAESAWAAYHGAIETARHDIEARFGRGLLVDLHGHGHPVQRLELGVLLSAVQLASTTGTIDDLADQSSLRALSDRTGSLSSLLRGPDAFGTLFTNTGVPAVPSAVDPFPLPGQAFFDGGYITLRHGSRDGGTIDAIQIEAPYPGLRDTPANIRTFALHTAAVIDEFLARHYGLVLAMDGPSRPPVTRSCLEVRSDRVKIHVRAGPTCDPPEGASIRIHDTLGRLVASTRWTSGGIVMETTGMAPGAYFLTMDGPLGHRALPFVHLR